MINFPRLFPWLVVAVAVVFVVAVASPAQKPAGQMDYEAFGDIPVLDHGRVKPIDTLARVSLLGLSGYETYKDADGKSQPATKWLLEVMTSVGRRDHESAKVKAFLIDDPAIRDQLQLPDRPDHLYAYEEFSAQIPAFMEKAKDIVKDGQKPRGEYETKVLDLATQVAFYDELSRFETPHRVIKIENDQLLNLLGLPQRSGFRYAFSEFAPRIGKLIQEAGRARKIDEKNKTTYDSELVKVARRVEVYLGLARWNAETLHLVAPLGPDRQWGTFTEAVQQLQAGGPDNPAARGMAKILTAYSDGKADGFNKEVADYRKLVGGKLADKAGLAEFESFFNHFAPFYYCAALYVLVFLLSCLSWVGFHEPLRRAAFWLAVFAFLVHTWAMGTRMYIHGRPPVTNLYSSAIFIGWVCLGMSIFMEVVFRNGLSMVVAGVVGFLTCLVAQYLAATSGDTMEMLVAVLDTQFWLATHVVCVTIGYASTFLAGFLGILFIVLGVFTPRLRDREFMKSLSLMIYGVVCFATFFSFVGTVLGGIWADQSWGRFWGWDPKENGALLIVIWNALILHARWAGLVKQRGVAVLAVVGNMVTGWSWFGTNQLSVGLHNYGFNSALATGLTMFWISQLVFLGIGLLPTRLWWSFAPVPAAAAPAAKAARKPATAAATK